MPALRWTPYESVHRVAEQLIRARRAAVQETHILTTGAEAGENAIKVRDFQYQAARP